MKGRSRWIGRDKAERMKEGIVEGVKKGEGMEMRIGVRLRLTEREARN